MITFHSDINITEKNDIFAEINSRYIAAIMMHGQLADYFHFLGLEGYAWLHEYQHAAESKERRKLCRYFLTHHGEMIEDHFSGDVKMIPDSWRTAKRLAVGKSTKQKAVEDGFAAYREWEEETKSVYEKYAGELLKGGNMADFALVSSIVDDVSGELKTIDCIVLNLISCGYDMSYVVESQKELKDRYKNRLKGIEVE